MIGSAARSTLGLAALLLSALCGFAPARVQGAAQCPRVELVCPAALSAVATDHVFSVRLDPPGDASRFAYDWVVSAGTIVSGLGTPAITLDAAGVTYVGTTVTVEVRGLPAGCPASASCTVPGRPGCGRPIDSYGDISFEDETARLDNLTVELQNSPDATGYIFCYGGRVGRAGEAQARCDRARDYLFTRRGIEASRVVAQDGGFRENMTVEFWAVPQNAQPPAPAPTVDPSEVKIIKGKGARGSNRRRN